MPPHPLASYQRPITGNQALLKADLTLMSPTLDEPHTQTVPLPPPPAKKNHTQVRAQTHTHTAILRQRLKAHERGRDKGDVSSFQMARAWLDMKRVGECLGEQKAGAMWEKGRSGSRAAVVVGGGSPLIKRIILRCTVLQRSCPLGPDWLQ